MKRKKRHLADLGACVQNVSMYIYHSTENMTIYLILFQVFWY